MGKAGKERFSKYYPLIILGLVVLLGYSIYLQSAEYPTVVEEDIRKDYPVQTYEGDRYEKERQEKGRAEQERKEKLRAEQQRREEEERQRQRDEEERAQRQKDENAREQRRQKLKDEESYYSSWDAWFFNIKSPKLEAEALLGLSGQYGPSQVKAAFREKSRGVHPDRSNSLEAQAEFIKLTNAKDLLLDML